jgi:hypothetical protein
MALWFYKPDDDAWDFVRQYPCSHFTMNKEEATGKLKNSNKHFDFAGRQGADKERWAIRPSPNADERRQMKLPNGRGYAFDETAVLRSGRGNNAAQQNLVADVKKMSDENARLRATLTDVRQENVTIEEKAGTSLKAMTGIVRQDEKRQAAAETAAQAAAKEKVQCKLKLRRAGTA